MKRKSIKFVAMTIHEASRLVLAQLQPLYDPREAANITDLVMENITGLQKIDRMVSKESVLSDESFNTLNKYISALNDHEPVQYVLGEAWFSGMKFYVNKNVLIPRPETEELVQWIIDENGSVNKVRIFDAGTGSGCIPVALKKKLQNSDVSCCDISEAALAVAKTNARGLYADIEFLLIDVLDHNAWNSISLVDIIVSNPPYIPWKEKLSMQKNVVAHEPHQALFVEDNDPLVFYKALAEMGRKKLRFPGKIYVEIHEDLAGETAEVFRLAGYNTIEIKKDMQGKDRMIRALLHPGLIDH
ncbi:MAG: peptide chain release factor N(5)-glutamine methyltransferase [Chitinophagaceae bacterium]|nr:peptide chain release factor N(5)-glutamine methyltransferase [Chitinophagaceae bacterium]